jgi:hypothetical protein
MADRIRVFLVYALVGLGTLTCGLAGMYALGFFVYGLMEMGSNPQFSGSVFAVVMSSSLFGVLPTGAGLALISIGCQLRRSVGVEPCNSDQSTARRTWMSGTDQGVAGGILVTLGSLIGGVSGLICLTYIASKLTGVSENGAGWQAAAMWTLACTAMAAIPICIGLALLFVGGVIATGSSRRLFGTFTVMIGSLMVLIFGASGILLLLRGLGGILRSETLSGWNMVVVSLVVGGIPALLGIGFVMAGLRFRHQ